MRSHIQNLVLIVGLLLCASVAWSAPCSPEKNDKIFVDIFDFYLDAKEGTIPASAFKQVKELAEHYNDCSFVDHDDMADDLVELTLD
jgi:hypothetical protein